MGGHGFRENISREAASAGGIYVVGTGVYDGVPCQCLAGRESGEDTPKK
jgi:hypothetical protein